MRPNELASGILSGAHDEALKAVYGNSADINAIRVRYAKCIDKFSDNYGKDHDVSVFSVSGRSEISGNHTDHNRGRVIAASINLDIIAVAAKNENEVIRVKSLAFAEDVFKPGDRIRKNNSHALIAGVYDGFIKNGYKAGGFYAYTESHVLKGSGLSSSAAFENAIGTVLNYLYNDGGVDFVKLAQISQYAENVFFGKPSGLMDQIACASGGFVGIDFRDPSNPEITRLGVDLDDYGINLVIINTGGSHANLTGDYASVPSEMKSVAAFFGKTVLREVEEDKFYASLSAVRTACGDRAVLRAHHFFCENRRVASQLDALKAGDIDQFLSLVRESGRSSQIWLQNIFACSAPSEQGLSVGLMLCERLLSDKRAAWRVHGGGFAGTVQAFVPKEYISEFVRTVSEVFGENSCLVLGIRSAGATKVI
ncbi:MAG: galactokinase family protein [Oscillospiraceae bacterium]|nr:galactokinase family protein [Oscillospiraceae bacterium]